MNEEFIQRCVQEIEDDIQRVGDSIVNGGCASFEDYKQKVGYISGQKRAIDCINEAYGRFLAS